MITGADIDGGSSALCGAVSLSANPSAFTCANLGPNNVTLTVTDGSGNTSTCTAVVTVTDTTPPTAVCKNITIALVQGTASITASQINGGSTSACGGPVTVSASPTNFNCSNLGPNNVTLTVTDGQGNTSTCTAVVTVIDTTPPTAVCKNITIALVGSTASITASQINGGSSASCGGVTLSASPTSFTCANLGPNDVTLTVTDGSGNTAKCTAVVTVIDNTPPVAVCKNVTLYLNGQGTASLTATQVDGGSTDNCTIVSRSVSKTSFNCSNIGTTPVTLTVTDESGNVDSCHATVTILDTIKPVAVCKSITVTLVNGTATITAAQIDGGSTDNCGIVSTTASQTTFTVANVGPNTVTLTVTDASGNKSTCTATVTVVNPSISCNVTATQTSCHTNGSTTLTVTSTGVAPFTYHWSPGTGLSCTNCASPVFTPTASGTYTFDVTVTDHNGSTTTCSITITVTPPPISCNVTASHTSCQQNSSTTLSVTSTGVAPFTYHWSPGTDLSCTTCASPVFTPTAPGTYTFDVTVTDHNGSTTTCSITVTVTAAPITCSAGANRTTVYLGYGAQTSDLSVTATGTAPFTYKWSPSTNLSCSNCDNPVFTPTAGGQYTFDVTVTDTYGSSTTCDVSICVLDIRASSTRSGCGSGGSQVYICESSVSSCGGSTETTVTMDSASVESYLASHPDDQLGSCGQSCSTEKEGEVPQLIAATPGAAFDVLLYPNPFSEQFHIQVRSANTDQINVRLLDLTGNVINETRGVQPGDEMKLGSGLAPVFTWWRLPKTTLPK